MKRRDLLIGAVALLGSAALGSGGVVYGLNAIGAAPKAAPVDTPPAAPTAEVKGTAVDARASATPTAGAAHDLAHWGYEGATGPQAWSELDSANALCKIGGSQSPVDLTGALQVPGLQSLQLNYQPTKVVLSNNGHTIQVNYEKGSSLTFSGKRFDLVQFHFHTPSEHTLDGRSYPLELHLVHQAADKSLAAIAVLIAEGAPSSPLIKFWNKLPRSPSDVDTGATITARDLMPRTTDDYYTYAGSLTTPPCSENVTWIVLRHTAEASKAQIAAFRDIFPINARPTSPLGARILLAS